MDPKIGCHICFIQAELHQSIDLDGCVIAITMQPEHVIALEEGDGLFVVLLMRVVDTADLSRCSKVRD